MKITISQPVTIQGENCLHHWSKEYGDRFVLPRKGDLIEDPLWKEPYEYEVTAVVINYDQDTCFVTVAQYENEISESSKDEFWKMADLHGWKASW